MSSVLTPSQQLLNDLWDEHIRDEFATKDAAAAIDSRRRSGNRKKDSRPKLAL
jgi:hypothetical protein